MNKLFKLGSLSLAVLCTIGLASCGAGLDEIEKNAKAYIKENADDFTAIDASGSGLKYNGAAITLNFVTDNGTYTSDNYEFTFKADYNWEEEELSFEVKKVTKGETEGTLEEAAYNIAIGLAKTEVTAAYVIIAGAAALYDAQQSE